MKCCKNPQYKFRFRLELDFIDFYGVLLEFVKRMSVNMQEINLEIWIMGRATEGANCRYFQIEFFLIESNSCKVVWNELQNYKEAKIPFLRTHSLIDSNT